MKNRLYDEGESGGSAATELDLGKAMTDEGKTGAGEESGKDTSAEQIATLTKERDELTTKNEGLSSKLGKQSESIGTLNKFQKAMKDDPEKFIKDLAAKNNIKLNTTESETLVKAIEDNDPEKVADAINSNNANNSDQLLKRVEGMLAPMQESLTAQRYNDWDDLGEDRESIAFAHQTQDLSSQELYHLAAKGKNMVEAIEAAGIKAVEDYKEQLHKKNQEQIDSSGKSDTETVGNEIGMDSIVEQLETP